MIKAIFKEKIGRTVLLCSKCYVVIKTKIEFNKKELKALEGIIELKAQYCDKCKNKMKK